MACFWFYSTFWRTGFLEGGILPWPDIDTFDSDQAHLKLSIALRWRNVERGIANLIAVGRYVSWRGGFSNAAILFDHG